MTTPTMRGTGAYELYEGDTILVGMTHEVNVGRDKSWIKYEAQTKLRPHETAEDARTRAIGHVNESVMTAVHTAVETARRYQ